MSQGPRVRQCVHQSCSRVRKLKVGQVCGVLVRRQELCWIRVGGVVVASRCRGAREGGAEWGQNKARAVEPKLWQGQIMRLKKGTNRAPKEMGVWEEMPSAAGSQRKKLPNALAQMQGKRSPVANWAALKSRSNRSGSGGTSKPRCGGVQGRDRGLQIPAGCKKGNSGKLLRGLPPWREGCLGGLVLLVGSQTPISC